MFEFAISQHQKHPPSRRFLGAVGISTLAHLATLAVLILAPAGPLPGLSSWFRPLAFLALAYFIVLLALARNRKSTSEQEIFEFAIAQHQKHPPSRRFLGAVAASIVAHIAAVILLIEFPSLLLPGLSSWLRPLAYLRVTVKEPDWRMVSMLGNSRMQMPSRETLRKLLPKKEGGPGSLKVSVPIRWGDEMRAPHVRVPVPQPVRKRVPGPEEPKPVPETEAGQTAGGGDPNRIGEGAQSSAGVEVAGTPGQPEKKPTIPLPPPSEPKQIPKKIEEVAQSKPAGTAPAASEAA